MSKLFSLQKSCESYNQIMRFLFITQSLISVPKFFRQLDTILYKTCWDTCSTNHHYVHNIKWHVWFNIHVLSMRLPPPSPTKQCWYTHASYSFPVHYLWQHWFWGAWNRVFITQCPNSFVQDCSTSSRLAQLWNHVAMYHYRLTYRRFFC